MTVEM